MTTCAATAECGSGAKMGLAYSIWLIAEVRPCQV